MAEQERVKRTTTSPSEHETEAVTGASASGEALKSELDDLLDEIDEVLETNAEEFVKSYIQKGGE